MADHNKGIINYGRIGGNANVRSGDVHIGDVVTARNSNVNLASQLEQVSQQTTDSDARKNLLELLTRLNEVLSKVPAEHGDAVGAVAAQARVIESAAAGPAKANRKLLEIAGHALKAAATGLLKIAPEVLSVTEGIIGVISTLTRQ